MGYYNPNLIQIPVESFSFNNQSDASILQVLNQKKNHDKRNNEEEKETNYRLWKCHLHVSFQEGVRVSKWNHDAQDSQFTKEGLFNNCDICYVWHMICEVNHQIIISILDCEKSVKKSVVLLHIGSQRLNQTLGLSKPSYPIFLLLLSIQSYPIFLLLLSIYSYPIILLLLIVCS